MMYDELIEGLRVIAKGETDGIFSEAADVIEGLSHAVEQMTEWRKNRWIPVTERLPEKIGYYLAHIANINQMSMATDVVALWDGNHFYVSSFVAVTHWMPLPEPPKEDEE